jgi:hypothetical protein
METKTKIETYSQAETLLEKLFQASRDNFITELKMAAETYFLPDNVNDPKEEKEIRRNIDVIWQKIRFSCHFKFRNEIISGCLKQFFE